METLQELLDEISNARGDLQSFAAIEALTEHSLFSAASHHAEASIRAICQREMRRCVRKHDRALAAAKAALLSQDQASQHEGAAR